MNKNIEKRNHIIHFIEKWLIIGIILFIIIQLTALGIINSVIPKEDRLSHEQYEKYDNDYIGHWYNGTFFINMTISENFQSREDYEVMLKDNNNNIIAKICKIGGIISITITTILLLICAFKERKKKLITGKTPLLITISGIIFLINKIFEEIDLFIETKYWSKNSIGFLKTARYYPQMHYIFILPVLLILLGLILRNMQMNKENKKTKVIIKTILNMILVIGISFILYRFCIRIYELMMVLLNKDINIRLPFYYYIFDLPKSYAISNNSYIKLVLLRFIKDLPIFISTSISIILFVKIIKSYLKLEIVTKENKKKYMIIFILLIISSLIFNILGIFEVNLLNKEFLYQYKEATYTIAIRSLTEPLLYGLFIYSFKHYVELGYISKDKKTS